MAAVTWQFSAREQSERETREAREAREAREKATPRMVPASQASTLATVRPSTWPSKPAVSSALTNPVCHRSRVGIHLPVAGPCFQRGRPRRVSSMPSTSASGGGASGTSRAVARKASITVGRPVLAVPQIAEPSRRGALHPRGRHPALGGRPAPAHRR